jgi:hypothetical protein
MEEQKLSAIENPALATKLAAEALAEPDQDGPKEVPIDLPSDTTVNLPGGFVTADGQVYRTAEVRELNGKDEEAISRATTIGKVLNTILSRGTVSVGSISANESVLDELFAGDRDELLLGIYRATFGNTATLNAYCSGCDEYKQIEVDVDTDIKRKVLADPVNDRYFTVQGKKNEFTVGLPTGKLQKELNANIDKTVAELGSLLLENTVVSIDGAPVYSKALIQALGIQDRRKISEEIAARAPGPKFDDVEVTCPECESKVVVPINLGALFQF